jgi:hypothetical protein
MVYVVIFKDMTRYNVASAFQRFRGIFCFHLQGTLNLLLNVQHRESSYDFFFAHGAMEILVMWDLRFSHLWLLGVLSSGI